MEIKIRRLILLWVVILSVCLPLTGQDEIYKKADSLHVLLAASTKDSTKARLFSELSDLYLYYFPDTSLYYSRKNLFYLIKSDCPEKDLVDAYGDLFNGHFFGGSSADSLLYYVRIQEKYMEESGDSVDRINVYWNYAMYYGNVGESDEEMAYYLKALNIAEQYQDKKDRIARLMNNIGGTLASKGNFTQALVYIKGAMEIVEDKVAKGNLLLNCSDIYINEFQKYDTA